METIKFEGIDAYYIFICKGHYENIYGKQPIITKLRMVQSLFCGYDYDSEDTSIDSYIANRMYMILIKSKQIDILKMQKDMHGELVKYWRYKNVNPIVGMILFYKCIISELNVFGDGYKIELPDHKKEEFNKFFSSDGKFDNELYNKLTK